MPAKLKHKRPDPPNPSGLCMCGCGQPTRIAKHTHPLKNILKGHPVRYITAHHLGPRFDYHVDAATGCWIWDRTKCAGGYARVRWNGRIQQASRVMYERSGKTIPEGYAIDHLCRNPSCVCPNHLEAVTDAENNRRGRKTKLTKEQVAEIKQRSGMATPKELAQEFGVGRSAIYRIINGQSWVK